MKATKIPRILGGLLLLLLLPGCPFEIEVSGDGDGSSNSCESSCESQFESCQDSIPVGSSGLAQCSSSYNQCLLSCPMDDS